MNDVKITVTSGKMKREYKNLNEMFEELRFFLSSGKEYPDLESKLSACYSLTKMFAQAETSVKLSGMIFTFECYI